MDHEVDDVNGAWRAVDGTFWMLPHRRFRTDGRERLGRDRLSKLLDELERTLAALESADTRHVLRGLSRAREQLDFVEHEAVAVVRSHGWAWQDIGGALGVCRSAAHKRFARLDVRRRRRP